MSPSGADPAGSGPGRTLRLRVSPRVARLVAPEAPRALRLEAAQGAVSLDGKEQLTALFFLGHGGDEEVRRLALATLKRLPAAAFAPHLRDDDLHPRLLDFVARVRFADPQVVEPLLDNPLVPPATLLWLAAHVPSPVLELLVRRPERLAATPGLPEALLANPAAGPDLRRRLGPSPADPFEAEGEEPEDGAEGEEESPPEEEINLSKYQQAMEMGVADKIKMALTGDKEWRTIFLKDPNKLVSSAVLKNPRITEGEVLAVAKNRSASDELIRLILLNREWLKIYEMKRALVMHPRTPLPRALRFMEGLGEKDIKQLAKSRSVSQVIVNNARRLLLAKQKKR